MMPHPSEDLCLAGLIRIICGRPGGKGGAYARACQLLAGKGERRGFSARNSPRVPLSVADEPLDLEDAN
jgi:hypothetical protein